METLHYTINRGRGKWGLNSSPGGRKHCHQTNELPKKAQLKIIYYEEHSILKILQRVGTLHSNIPSAKPKNDLHKQGRETTFIVSLSVKEQQNPNKKQTDLPNQTKKSDITRFLKKTNDRDKGMQSKGIYLPPTDLPNNTFLTPDHHAMNQVRERRELKIDILPQIMVGAFNPTQ